MLHSYMYSITEKYAVRGGGLYQHLVAHENRLEMGLFGRTPRKSQEAQNEPYREIYYKRYIIVE